VDMPPCPACTAMGLTLVQKGELSCSYCGSAFKGIPLICPSCGWINTIDAEDCPECGEPLSVIAQVISRQDKAGGPQWMKRVQSQLGEIRSAEERASQIRLQALQEVDQKREESLAEQKIRQSQAERNLLMIAFIVALLIIMSVIIIGLLLR
jgi:hypothetical protein